MRQELAADEGQEHKRRAKNERGSQDRRFGVVKAPLKTAGVGVANPIENAVWFFLDAFIEPRVRENGNKRKREEKSANKGESHGIRHRMEELSRRPTEGVNRQISGDDHRDGIKDWPVHVASRRQN